MWLWVAFDWFVFRKLLISNAKTICLHRQLSELVIMEDQTNSYVHNNHLINPTPHRPNRISPRAIMTGFRIIPSTQSTISIIGRLLLIHLLTIVTSSLGLVEQIGFLGALRYFNLRVFIWNIFILIRESLYITDSKTTNTWYLPYCSVEW